VIGAGSLPHTNSVRGSLPALPLEDVCLILSESTPLSVCLSKCLKLSTLLLISVTPPPHHHQPTCACQDMRREHTRHELAHANLCACKPCLILIDTSSLPTPPLPSHPTPLGHFLGALSSFLETQRALLLADLQLMRRWVCGRERERRGGGQFGGG
jgi:hypothetical protein